MSVAAVLHGYILGMMFLPSIHPLARHSSSVVPMLLSKGLAVNHKKNTSASTRCQSNASFELLVAGNSDFGALDDHLR